VIPLKRLIARVGTSVNCRCYMPLLCIGIGIGIIVNVTSRSSIVRSKTLNSIVRTQHLTGVVFCHQG
jgi:hypothetical protein